MKTEPDEEFALVCQALSDPCPGPVGFDPGEIRAWQAVTEDGRLLWPVITDRHYDDAVNTADQLFPKQWDKLLPIVSMAELFKRAPITNPTPTTSAAFDPVNRPEHYATLSPEPIEVIRNWKMNFNLGTVIKYLARAGRKDPAKYKEDLEKARWYLTQEIEHGDVDG